MSRDVRHVEQLAAALTSLPLCQAQVVGAAACVTASPLLWHASRLKPDWAR